MNVAWLPETWTTWKLSAEEITELFASSDGSRSRAAIEDLVSKLCSKTPAVSLPKFLPFDPVQVLPPNTERRGHVRLIVWHFKHCCWNYYLESDTGKKVSKRYVEHDLKHRASS